MAKWKTKLTVNSKDESIHTKEPALKRGIFQDDSFSALWLCVALNPISDALKRTDYGFTIKAG